MRTKAMLRAAAFAVLVPALAGAQERPALEIGMKGGLAITQQDVLGESVTMKAFDLPTGMLYLAFFPSELIFVEPEFSFDWLSNGESVTAFRMNAWLSFAPAGVTQSSAYFGAAPSLQYADFGDDSDSEWGASGRVGYRAIVRESLALRVEAGYTRWFDAEINVFTVQVGVGALLKRAM